MYQNQLAFNELSLNTQNLVDTRQEKYETLFNQGVEALNLARAENFKNLSLVKQALHVLVEAIQYNRKNAQPYIYLAYTFLIFQKMEQAQIYLKEALRLNPQDTLVHDMLSFALGLKKNLAARTSQNPVRILPAFFPSPKAVNCQTLYADLERKILETLKNQSMDPMKSNNDLSHLKKQDLQSQMNAINSVIQMVQSQVKSLAPRDVKALELKLKPLQSLSQRLEGHMRAQNNQGELRRNIQDTLQVVENYSAQIQNGKLRISEREDLLATLFERCDQYADQLDQWQELGIPIEGLESDYENLVALVSELQKSYTCT